MAEKTFINNSPATLQITLFIRQGANPVNQDGTSSFTLNPGQTLTITYGDAPNIFLNGILMFTIFAGDLYSKIQFVTVSGSELDDLLNTNDTVTITKELTDYVISGSNPALDAVNDAQTVTEMRVAIENPQLGLDLTAYNSLTEAQKDQVAGNLLTNRPVGGYPTVVSVQAALDNAINEIVDPNNIFVSAGAVGGNGSAAQPFGTITQGIAAVNPGGTVHILSGTYLITTQIVVNKAGITLKGEAGTQLLLQANLIPLLITAPNVTVDGLTITSDIPYAREFIQIGANNVTLRNNTIFGPPQALPMSNWVVNRAVVSQGGLTGLLIENNTFHSLRTGMYINPNGMGAINNNVVYNTKGGFLVDRAFTTFNGNSWGIPANEFDIVLLAGTTTGPPYDNLAALSAANNGATISDQRGL
ncbi:right-handed parallel beta-helix repeat-containing protein [Bacillus sp. ISL-75]|uniref:right-handed parallel beta-helix repeat-containing protein n=1 Tax=Bacillus sp. ISL-75 TaxID=2819137 RepID=UPI001BEBE280|nr:right-handed parallel beta-helix repeat-containing protein [Bacillus sp. ISL-75]MBT2730211.1 right-handed parallel beta-helix repeat-containing protein [Bacillus sp. ISL-75]